MKKIILFVAVFISVSNAIAQKKTYLLFEFMKVSPAQEAAYLETENFWNKIHDQRVKSGEIMEWQFWRLQPGGENQNYQYVTVQVFDDPARFFKESDDAFFLNISKKAFPKMSEADLLSKRVESLTSRDLSDVFYVEEIDETKGRFNLAVGAVMGINFIKVSPVSSKEYENAESKIFKPEWQSNVDAGRIGKWNLLKLIPLKEDDLNKTSYISLDKFKDFNQLYGSSKAFYNTIHTSTTQQAWQEALTTRQINSYTAVLIKKTTK